MNATSEKRVWLRAVLRISGSVVILTLLLYFLPIDKLWAGMRRVSPSLAILVLLAYMAAHIIGVMKWRLMVNLAGAGLSFAGAARCYFAGLFANLFLPSLVGGDVVRAGLALRLGRSKAGVLLGSLLDRMLDVVVLTLIAGTSALLLPGTLDPQGRRVFWTIAAALGIGAGVALAILALLARRRFSFRMRRRLVRVRQAWRSMARRPQYVLLAMSLAVVIQVSFVALIARIGEACGLDVLLRVWLFAYPMAKLIALLPISQGGIGVRELALAALLAPFGAPAVLTVAAAFVWTAVNIAGGLLAGLASLFLGRSATDEP